MNRKTIFSWLQVVSAIGGFMMTSNSFFAANAYHNRTQSYTSYLIWAVVGGALLLVFLIRWQNGSAGLGGAILGFCYSSIKLMGGVELLRHTTPEKNRLLAGVILAGAIFILLPFLIPKNPIPPKTE